MSFAPVEPGVIRVLYDTEADMAPQSQAGLLRALENQLTFGPVGIVFAVPRVAVVDRSVPTFWLDITKRMAPKLCALAIASPSVAVRTAARAFAVANTVRGVGVTVTAFNTEDEALRWVRAQVRAQGG